jgi:hypothetical protein
VPLNTRPACLELLAVGVVDLVAVPVSLVDRVVPYAWRRHSRGKVGRIGAQPHRAAQVAGASTNASARPSSRSPAGCLGSNSVEPRPRCRPLRAYSITMHCSPRHIPSVGICSRGRSAGRRACPRCPARRNLPARARHQPPRALAAPASVAQSSEATQRMRTLASVLETRRAQRLRHRQVGVGQVDVLADQGDLHGMLGVVDAVEQIPRSSSPRRGRQARGAAPRRRPDPRCAAPSGCRRCWVRRRHATTASWSTSHISEILRLMLSGTGDRHAVPARRAGCRPGAARPPSAGSAWSSAHPTARGRAPARRAGRRTVVAAEIVAHLAGGLQERQRLDVTDGAADLGDDDGRARRRWPWRASGT